jgi:hypothetical protein
MRLHSQLVDQTERYRMIRLQRLSQQAPANRDVHAEHRALMDAALARDAAQVFNYITGYVEPQNLQHLAMSPMNLRSTQSSIMSRIISPEIPPPWVATQVMISRSWVSMANAMRTTSPFQQVISNPSEAQRWLEAGAMTTPSCARMTLLPVQGCSRSEAMRIRRKTRLWLSDGLPEPRLARFSRAVTRR